MPNSTNNWQSTIEAAKEMLPVGFAPAWHCTDHFPEKVY
jgi:hypothetical protein